MKAGRTLKDQAYLAGRNGGSRGEVSPTRILAFTEGVGEGVQLEGGEEGEIVDALQQVFELALGSLKGTEDGITYGVGIGEGELQNDPRYAPIDLVGLLVGVYGGSATSMVDTGTDSRALGAGIDGVTNNLDLAVQELGVVLGDLVEGEDSGTTSKALEQGELGVDGIRDYPEGTIGLEGEGLVSGLESIQQAVEGGSGRNYASPQKDLGEQGLALDLGARVANREKDNSIESVGVDGGRGEVSPELGGQGLVLGEGDSVLEVDGGDALTSVQGGRGVVLTREVGQQTVVPDIGGLLADYLGDPGGQEGEVEVGVLRGGPDGEALADLGLSSGLGTLDQQRDYSGQGELVESGSRAVCTQRDACEFGVGLQPAVGSFPVRISNADSVFLYESVSRMTVKYLWEVVASGLLPVVVWECTVGLNGVTADREVLPYPEFIVHPLWYLPVKATADYTGITVDRGLCADFLEYLTMDSVVFRVSDRTGYQEFTMDTIV